MKKPPNPRILITDPHGAQSLYQVEPSTDKIGNRLFELAAITYGTKHVGHIVMTGEELTSLANQWLEYAKTQGTANAPAQRPDGREACDSQQPERKHNANQ